MSKHSGVTFEIFTHHKIVTSFFKGVVAERIRAPNPSSGASVQQSVSLNPGRDTCVLEQDT